jgi:alkylation response protein AidB-like acyl-CoA dehydrogenase
MDFGLSGDEEALQAHIRTVLERRCPTSLARAMYEEGPAEELVGLYGEIAKLGWMGTTIPERWGGQGMSFIDLVVLIEETGRALLPGPLFSTVALGVPVIMAGATKEQASKVLPGIASGEVNATVAFTELSGLIGPEGITLPAKRRGDSFVLNGTKAYVTDAHVADRLVIAARTSVRDSPELGVTLFLVDRNTIGVKVTPTKSLDMSRQLSTVTLTDVVAPPESILGEVDHGWPVLNLGFQTGSVLLAAESIGGAQKVLDMTVDYAKVRRQFGRAIGGFQAVKHRLAEMLMKVEIGRTAEYYAGWAVSESSEELPIAASMAKAFCTEIYTQIVEAGIQTHGGIGFTWEHDLHLYLRRAKSNEMFLGQPSHHREAVAQLVAGGLRGAA